MRGRILETGRVSVVGDEKRANIPGCLPSQQSDSPRSWTGKRARKCHLFYYCLTRVIARHPCVFVPHASFRQHATSELIPNDTITPTCNSMSEGDQVGRRF